MEVVCSAKAIKHTRWWKQQSFPPLTHIFQTKSPKIICLYFKKWEGTGGVMTHTLGFFGNICVGKLPWLETEVFQTGRRIR